MITSFLSVQPLKLGDGYVISFHTSLGGWLLTHAGIKFNNVSNDVSDWADVRLGLRHFILLHAHLKCAFNTALYISCRF